MLLNSVLTLALLVGRQQGHSTCSSPGSVVSENSLTRAPAQPGVVRETKTIQTQTAGSDGDGGGGGIVVVVIVVGTFSVVRDL